MRLRWNQGEKKRRHLEETLETNATDSFPEMNEIYKTQVRSSDQEKAGNRRLALLKHATKEKPPSNPQGHKTNIGGTHTGGREQPLQQMWISSQQGGDKGTKPAEFCSLPGDQTLTSGFLFPPHS